MCCHFPFDLCRQTAPSPAAPGVGFPPGQVHGWLIAQHAARLTKTGLHHGATGYANLLNIARRTPAFICSQTSKPLPAISVPKLGPVVATVIDKLNKLRPGHGLSVNLELRHLNHVLWFFIVKSKTGFRVSAHLPQRCRNQHWLTQTHGCGR